MMEHEIPHFNHLQINRILHDDYHLVGELNELPGYCDQNLLLKILSDQQYVVKITHADGTINTLQMQNQAMAHLAQQGLPVPCARANTHGQLITHIAPNRNTRFYLRVLKYLPGSFYANSHHQGKDLWRHLGQFMAQIDQGFGDFQCQEDSGVMDWDLAYGLAVCQSKQHLLNKHRRQLVEHFLIGYQQQVQALLPQLPKGLIHCDANGYNLLIDHVDHPRQIIGLIDFGDITYSHLVNELAICSAYALFDQDHPLEVIATIASGYHLIRPLQTVELSVLFHLVALRLCTTLCNVAFDAQTQPDNQYLYISVPAATQALMQLKNIDPMMALSKIRTACGLDD